MSKTLYEIFKPKGRGGPGRGQGRRAVDGASGMTRYCVMLDHASMTLAKELGDGNLSVGIRRALHKEKEAD